MKRVSRVLLFLLIFAKTESSDKETFILDLMEKETFKSLVDPTEALFVEHLPKSASTIRDYTKFKEAISPFLEKQDKEALADLYDTFVEIKANKWVKDLEKNPDDFDAEMTRKINLYQKFDKDLLREIDSEEAVFDVSLDDVLVLDELADSILLDKESLDEAISKKSENWTIKRMAKPDLALLRMGVYELGKMDANLINLVDDYVEIAKAYCGEDSYKFINAILDTYYKEEVL